MRLRLKEDPKEWRKAGWLGSLGLALLSSLLWWRHALPMAGWIAALTILAGAAIAATLKPRLFRGYYRFGTRLSFHVTRAAGYVALTIFFLFVMAPMGLMMRLFGKDLLRLKRRSTDSFWVSAPRESSLERMF